MLFSPFTLLEYVLCAAIGLAVAVPIVALSVAGTYLVGATLARRLALLPREGP